VPPTKKPDYCHRGCPLAKKGFGYAPATGPADAEILIVGEALGVQEAVQGVPFVGDAGAMLDKCLRFTGIERESLRIDNTVRCKPPNNWLDGAPWEAGAIKHCNHYLHRTLEERHNVIVPVGGIAIRNLLDYSPKTWRSFKKPLENFHGTIHWSELYQAWIIPTYHPAFLQRGNHNLVGVLMHDLVLAQDIAKNGHRKQTPTLRVDPPVEWFLEWCQIIIAKSVESVAAGENVPWLAVDIETPEKEKGIDESEAAVDDPSYIITRVNFATEYDLDFALTVPWTGPYISGIAQLLKCTTLRPVFWNINYDVPRLRKNGIRPHDYWDFMDAWHMLQSRLPRGLGFVAPFYSRFGAWKHLSSTQPGQYAAIDALQTIRCTVGIERDLEQAGQWDSFERHGHDLDVTALKPAEDVGLPVDKKALEDLQDELEKERQRIHAGIDALIPEELIPLEPKGGYKRFPIGPDKKPKPGYFEVVSKQMCYKCLACGKVDVTTKHRCKEKKTFLAEHASKSSFTFDEWEISRWYKKGKFNPASPVQVLRYIKYKGHKPGRDKKSKNESADVVALTRLSKSHKDPFYKYLLELRKIDKIKGTYVDGALRKVDENGRIHTVFSNLPYTWRMSSQVFNLHNVVSKDKREDEKGLGKRFRACVAPSKGRMLVEADFGGIESVQVGWFSNDPEYISLSKMSLHSFIATHMPEFDDEVAEKDWPADKLKPYLKYIKNEPKYTLLYNKSKRASHGIAYGLTAYGLKQTYPELYPAVSDAQAVLDLIFKTFPKVKAWQEATRKLAHEQHYLGGATHPFRYKAWFWNVYTYDRVTEQVRRSRQYKGMPCVQFGNHWYAVSLGDDGKTCIAYFPQSTAGGVIREACLRLFTPGSEYYIGNLYYGKTPFRMPIHDSIVLEVPKSKVDYAIEKLVGAMKEPIRQQPCPAEWGMGPYLEIDVDVEVGSDWSKMEKVYI
jgi:DNA polymerase